MADDKLLRPSQARLGFVREAKSLAIILGLFVGAMWLSEIVDQVIFRGGLDGFGIQPRSIIGLQGILFAPFLHVGFAHLTANTLPLLVLGFFIMLRRKRDLLYVSLISGLIGGLGTWLIGAGNSVHLGASILVFGYLGYLLALGVFERKLWTILGSLAVFFLYGSALWGALPSNNGISWEGHAFGLIGGIIAARVLAVREIKAASAEAKLKVRQVR
ncbi:MAG: rhomboid family intramembrane serine protease [Polyangiaceae bacterium]|nr:rhomboid family intramembrane serine protease [Polyangiaceae bacterium]